MSKYTRPFEHLSLLGQEVKDRVTGYDGVVTHVGFDLYGCIQAIVNKPGVDNNGELNKGVWFDVNRLEVISSLPIMEPPTFIHEPEGADVYKPAK